MSICYRYEKNEQDAVALLNQSFLKIINKLNTYDQTKAFEPWIKRITVNEAIDAFRKKKNTRLQTVFLNGEQWQDEADTGLETDVENQDLTYHDYINMMNELDEPARTIFNLYAIDDYPHADIAAELGISVRSSKRHLSKARHDLQAMIVKRQRELKQA